MRYRITLALFVLFIRMGLLAQDRLSHWSLFTNATQNLDISHPRANLGVELEKSRSCVRSSAGLYYWNYWSSGAASGASFDINYQFPLDTQDDLSIGVALGGLHYTGYGEGNSNPVGIDKTWCDLYTTISFRHAWGDRFWGRPFAGLGIRYKWIHEHPLPDNDIRTPLITAETFRYRDRIGDLLVPTFRLGLLIGRRLRP